MVSVLVSVVLVIQKSLCTGEKISKEKSFSSTIFVEQIPNPLGFIFLNRPAVGVDGTGDGVAGDGVSTTQPSHLTGEPNGHSLLARGHLVPRAGETLGVRAVILGVDVYDFGLSLVVHNRDKYGLFSLEVKHINKNLSIILNLTNGVMRSKTPPPKALDPAPRGGRASAPC